MHRTRPAIASIVALALLAVVSAPMANAKGKTVTKHAKLTGVVTNAHAGTTNGPAEYISVRQGSKKVGTMLIESPLCAINSCASAGRADLKVGKLRGRLKLRLKFSFKGIPPKPPKFGLGEVYNSHGSETFRVNVGSLPRNQGGRFTFTLAWTTS
jgi:hypothetical protein